MTSPARRHFLQETARLAAEAGGDIPLAELSVYQQLLKQLYQDKTILNAPHLYDTAQQEELQFFNAVADCLAQCAATFGGGIAAFGEMPLLTILRWTHRAVLLTRPAEEDGE